ncbi:MAG: SEC-C metal-binding domain-containing protein [Muribaculaceae bacterium]|nr:SEC-C metal-binding domain-containing protein [Muribaculaceae bacterium]
MEPQSFTVEYRSLVPQLITECGVCEAYIPIPGKTAPKVFKFQALWDTGATCTTISENVVRSLGLIPIGFGDVSHAGGVRKAGLYRVNIALPNGLQSAPMKVLDGVLHGFDILIGMDIISQGDFAVTHSDGKTTFSFRLPSMEKIDFVDAPQLEAVPKKATPKVGRNEPCPCGSGKKYKKCCGLKQ